MSKNGQDPYNRAGMHVFLGTFGVTCLFMIYISFFHPGVHYDTIREKGSPGVKLASFDPSTVDKPWESSEDLIKYGAKKYATYCASCHGKSGKGDGPSAAGLRPIVRNLVEGDWQHGGDTIALYKLVFDGSPGTQMAAYGGTFAPAEIWALIHYVQSITKNKKVSTAAQLEAFAKSQ